MDCALLGLTSEQVTFALVIALGLFFLCLQLQRFARLARRERDQPPDDSQEEPDQSHEEDSTPPV